MKKVFFILSVLMVFFVTSCEKEDGETPKPYFGYNYAPLHIGSSNIYKVDSIVYDDFILPVSVDTFHYFVKEEVEEIFVDGENRESYKVGRYLKMDSTQSWNLDRIFTLTRTKQRLERFEENVTTVNLIFPVREGEKWNGNAMNSMSEQEYVLENVHHSMNLNNHYFDSTAKVIQQNEKNLIEKKYKEEIYAANKGLIFKKSEMLETELNGNVRSGKIVTYTFDNPIGLFPQ